MAQCSAGYGNSNNLEWEARNRDGGRLTERLGGKKDIKKNNEKECHDLHLDDHCLQISRRYGALVLHAVLLDNEVTEGEERDEMRGLRVGLIMGSITK
jgi:hypothetical protein